MKNFLKSLGSIYFSPFGRIDVSRWLISSFVISILFVIYLLCVDLYFPKIQTVSSMIVLLLLPTAFIYSYVCLYIKRLHDVSNHPLTTGESLLPVNRYTSSFLVFALFCTGTKGPNKYGPDPLEKHKT